MDQVPLVAGQMEDGQRFVDWLTRDGIPVAAAAWVRESEEGPWFFYLVTPLVTKDGGTLSAYGLVNEVMQRIPQPFWVDPLEYKVIAPDGSVGKAILDLHRQYPGLFPRWYKGAHLGGRPIEAAYIYPPVSVPVAKAEK